jgi:hypothetical protein
MPPQLAMRPNIMGGGMPSQLGMRTNMMGGSVLMPGCGGNLPSIMFLLMPSCGGILPHIKPLVIFNWSVWFPPALEAPPTVPFCGGFRPPPLLLLSLFAWPPPPPWFFPTPPFLVFS